MAYELPEKLKKLEPYVPNAGDFRIRLDANESFLLPPDWLREKVARAMAQVAYNRYPDPVCTELCARFASYFGVNTQHVVAGNGSDELIGLIISSFADYGESIAVVKPDFSMYAFYAQMCGVHVETFEKDPASLVLDADALIAFVKEKKVQLLIFSNPCNPTSLRASREDILKIVNRLDCLVVVDEAYMDFSEGSILQEAAGNDHLIVLKTFSKAFGMAAIRLGFAVAGTVIASALRAAKSPYNVNAMTQAAGCVLFDEPEYLAECITCIKASRDRLFQDITALSACKKEIRQVVNTCANFVFLYVENAKDIAEKLARRGIAVRFMGSYLRISAGSEQENAEIVGLLRELLH